MTGNRSWARVPEVVFPQCSLSAPLGLVFVVNALAAAVVFAASVPVAYLISPTAAKITWISLVPIGWLLGRCTARWRRTTDTA